MSNPSDGRLSSLAAWSGALSTTAIMEVVSPGNASAGINYQITIANLASAVGAGASIAGGTVQGNPTSTTGSVAATSAPVLGIPGTSFGTIGLASGTSGGATVTLGNPAATTGYQFNLPSAVGATGAFLASGGDGTATPNTWLPIASALVAGTGIAVSGTVTATLSLASQPGLSVLAVNSSGTAVPTPITGGGAGQVLAINAGGTGINWTSGSGGSVPAPWSGTTVTQYGIVYGMGTSAISATLAGTTNWILTGQGTAVAPVYKLLDLGVSVTSRLAFSNVTTVAGLSVLGAAGTSATSTLAPIVGGTSQVLRVDPGGTTVAFGAIDLTTTAAVSGRLPFSSVATIAGLSVAGVAGTTATTLASITGGTSQVLRVADNGTSLAFGALNLNQSGTAVTGTLLIANGGIGTNVLITGGVLFGQNTNTVGITAAGTTGWPLIGQGAAAPVFTTLGFVGGGTNATTATQALANMTGASLLATGQILTAGFRPQPFNLGTISAATSIALDPGNGGLQRLLASSNFSFVAPSVDGAIDVFVKNGAGASTITISNYSAANTGATYTTSNGSSFIFMSRTISASSTYQWIAYQ